MYIWEQLFEIACSRLKNGVSVDRTLYLHFEIKDILLYIKYIGILMANKQLKIMVMAV
jgi:hypothetical protein